MNSLKLKCPQCGQVLEQFYFLTSKPPKYQIQCYCGMTVTNENAMDTQEEVDIAYEDELHLPEKASLAQAAYCKEKNTPLFAPPSGLCWRCGRNIYSKDGYTVKEAKTELITSCPFCHGSFID